MAEKKSSSCLSGCTVLVLTMSTIVLAIILSLALFLRLTAFEPSFYKQILAETNTYQFVTNDLVYYFTDDLLTRQQQSAEQTEGPKFPLDAEQTAEFINGVIDPVWLKQTVEAKLDNLSGFLWGLNNIDVTVDLASVRSRLGTQLDKYGEDAFNNFPICTGIEPDVGTDFQCRPMEMTYQDFLDSETGQKFLQVVQQLQTTIPDKFDLNDPQQFPGFGETSAQEMIRRLQVGYQIASIVLVVLAGIILVQLGLLTVLVRRHVLAIIAAVLFIIALILTLISVGVYFDFTPLIMRVDMPAIALAKLTEVIDVVKAAVTLRLWISAGVLSVLAICTVVVNTTLGRLAKSVPA